MKRIYGILTSAGLAGLLASFYFVTVNAEALWTACKSASA